MGNDQESRVSSSYSSLVELLKPPLMFLAIWGLVELFIYIQLPKGREHGSAPIGLACSFTLLLMFYDVFPYFDRLHGPDRIDRLFESESPGKTGIFARWTKLFTPLRLKPSTKRQAFTKAVSVAVYSVILAIAFWISQRSVLPSSFAVSLLAIIVMFSTCLWYYRTFKDESIE